jgi:SAM-dependent methyltransferase
MGERCWDVDMHLEGGVSKNRFVLARIDAQRGAALEIGCAPGRLLFWLRWAARFTDIIGIDNMQFPDIEDIELFSAQAGNVIRCDWPAQADILFGWINKNCLFDYIVGLDVFEHSFAPVEFLMKSREVMKKGGQLFLMLPLADDIPAGSRFWAPREHVYLHSAQHMVMMLKNTGFGELRFDRWCLGHDTISARKL